MAILNRNERKLSNFSSNALALPVISSIAFALLVFSLFAYYMFGVNGSTSSLRKCCLDNKAVLFFSLPGTQSFSSLLLPLMQYTTVDEITYQEMESDGTKWNAAALKTDNVGTLVAEFSKEIVKKKLLPLVSVVLDNNGSEYLLLIGKEGQVCLSSMKFLMDNFFIDLKGKPSVEVKVPTEWGSLGQYGSFYLKVN